MVCRGSEMSKRIAVLVFILFVLLLVVVDLVGAQSSVPVNGSFTASLGGWYGLNANENAGWYSADGYGASGSYRLTNGSSELVSLPIVPTVDTVVSLYVKHPSGGGVWRFGVIDWESGTGGSFTWLTNEDSSIYSSWTQMSQSLSSYAGRRVSLLIHSRDGDWRFDDVVASNASNAYVGVNYNSYFTSDARGWYGTSSYGNGWQSSGGNPGGAYYSQNNGGWGYTFVYPFKGGGVWNFDVKGDGSFGTPVIGAYVQNASDSVSLVTYQVFTEVVYSDTWQTKVVDLTSFAGKTISLFFMHTYNGGSAKVFIDNFRCVSGSCYADPTPTPTPTSPYFPYGYGTPIPIDWGQFPTPVPYPTFPAFPTQVPYPTSIYGPGTPVPVIQVTPFPTQLPHATPIYGVNTPIPINWPTATRTATAVVFPTVSSGVSADPLAQVDFRNLNIGFIDPLVFGGGGGSSGFCDGSEAFGRCLGPTSGDIVDVHFARRTYDYTLFNIWGFDRLGIPNMGVRFHILYPDRLVFAGIELLAPIYGLGGMFFLVFALRVLQKR